MSTLEARQPQAGKNDPPFRFGRDGDPSEMGRRGGLAKAAKQRQLAEDARALVLEELARQAYPSLQKIAEVRDLGESEANQLAASRDILDRFMGKPGQSLAITAEATRQELSPEQIEVLKAGLVAQFGNLEAEELGAGEIVE